MFKEKTLFILGAGASRTRTYEVMCEQVNIILVNTLYA